MRIRCSKCNKLLKEFYYLYQVAEVDPCPDCMNKQDYESYNHGFAEALAAVESIRINRLEQKQIDKLILMLHAESLEREGGEH